MKVEFEVRESFANDGRPLFGEPKMEEVLKSFANFLLVTMDETIRDVKINGKDVIVY